MKNIIIFALMLTPVVSNGQELLGKTQSYIINNFKDRDDAVISEINDTTLTYKYNYGKQYISFSFKNNRCIVEGMSCTKESKNYFIIKYVEEGYNVSSISKDGSLFIEFKNDIYFIQMIVVETGNRETDLYLMFISYLSNKK